MRQLRGALRGTVPASSSAEPTAARSRAGRSRSAQQGHEAQGVTFDARSVQDIGRSVDAVCDYFGRCDILVNCVGIHSEQMMLEVTEETYDKVLAINLKAGMFLGQAVARRQVAAKNGGKQVHLLSVRAKLGLRGKGYSAYASSKGGLLMMVKQHASELAPHGINVNGVAPTFVYTEMSRHATERPAVQGGGDRAHPARSHRRAARRRGARAILLLSRIGLRDWPDPVRRRRPNRMSVK